MKKLLAALILTAGIGFAQFSVGIHIGQPPRPRVIRVRPVAPGPGYSWIDGYWYPVGSRYTWHEGYWTRPAYAGAHWVEPRHDGERYYAGYWDGDHGQVAHDHSWDKNHDRNRDYNRDQHER